MSLDFNTSLIATEFKQDPEDATKWHPMLDIVLWSMMVIGGAAITPKNFEQVLLRLMEWQCIDGPLIRFKEKGKLKTAFIGREELSHYIGLRTNVMPMSDVQWAKRKAQMVRDRTARILNQLEMVKRGETVPRFIGEYPDLVRGVPDAIVAYNEGAAKRAKKKAKAAPAA